MIFPDLSTNRWKSSDKMIICFCSSESSLTVKAKMIVENIKEIDLMILTLFYFVFLLFLWRNSWSNFLNRWQSMWKNTRRKFRVETMIHVQRMILIVALCVKSKHCISKTQYCYEPNDTWEGSAKSLTTQHNKNNN